MILDPFTFVIVTLAAYRVTRFLVWDSLMGANLESHSWWARFIDRFAYTPEGHNRSWWRGKIGDLLVCPFCTGFWVALALTCGWSWVAPWDLGRPGWFTVFAVAGAAAMLNIFDRAITGGDE